jgi:preprotein translocase subunit YajC
VDALGALFPFLLILAAFYLLIIRPARTRQRAAMQLQEQLAPGLEVMTTSGMFGRISAVSDDRVSVDLAPGVTVQFAKAAIARVLSEPEVGNDVADDGSDERTA